VTLSRGVIPFVKNPGKLIAKEIRFIDVTFLRRGTSTCGPIPCPRRKATSSDSRVPEATHRELPVRANEDKVVAVRPDHHVEKRSRPGGTTLFGMRGNSTKRPRHARRTAPEPTTARLFQSAMSLLSEEGTRGRFFLPRQGKGSPATERVGTGQSERGGTHHWREGRPRNHRDDPSPDAGTAALGGTLRGNGHRLDAKNNFPTRTGLGS